jgi:hypothetical protein
MARDQFVRERTLLYPMLVSLGAFYWVLGHITSTNGATFKRASGAPNANWKSIAMSYTTGQFVIASVEYGPLYVSSDYGQSWTVSSAPYGSWSQVGVSSDGRYQIACGLRAPIYLSNDYGGSWYETAFVGNGPVYQFTTMVSTSLQHTMLRTSTTAQTTDRPLHRVLPPVSALGSQSAHYLPPNPSRRLLQTPEYFRASTTGLPGPPMALGRAGKRVTSSMRVK